MTAPECLRTRRLQLRKPVPEDAALLFEAYGQDPEVARYVPWRPHRSLSESEALIERLLSGWETGSGFHWLLFPRDGAGLAGAVGIRREMHRVELGYVLARPFWGQGLMVEAAGAVVEWLLAIPPSSVSTRSATWRMISRSAFWRNWGFAGKEFCANWHCTPTSRPFLATAFLMSKLAGPSPGDADRHAGSWRVFEVCVQSDTAMNISPKQPSDPYTSNPKT